jgi:hypothetical protein
VKEIVLPSGRFATLRPLKWADRVMTYGLPEVEQRIMALAVRTVCIDGEPLTMQQAQEMELTEAEPIIQAIVADMLAGYQSKGIA